MDIQSVLPIPLHALALSSQPFAFCTCLMAANYWNKNIQNSFNEKLVIPATEMLTYGYGNR